MAKNNSTTTINKTQTVWGYLKKNPDLKPKEIQEMIQRDHGVPVDAGQISVAKNQFRKRVAAGTLEGSTPKTAKKKTVVAKTSPAARQGTNFSYEELQAVASFAKEHGGLDRVEEAIASLRNLA